MGNQNSCANAIKLNFSISGSENGFYFILKKSRVTREKHLLY